MATIPRRFLLLAAFWLPADSVMGEPEAGNAAPAASTATAEQTTNDQLVPLNKQGTVTLDRENKRLLLKTRVVLREGVLEMFLCKAGTKEHESIVVIDADVHLMHAGLLALGARSGRPAQFEPAYVPPQGQTIDIYVNWTDEAGVAQREPAGKWVRHVTRRYYVEPLAQLPPGFQMPEGTELRYDERRQEIIWFGPMTAKQRDELLALSDNKDYHKAIGSFFERSQTKEMDAQFIFAGSGFYEAEDGTRHYLAESGNVICVANFSDAMIDVDVKSSADNEGLMFEPFTERIPPLDTEITIELIPRLEKKSADPPRSPQ